MAGTSPAMTNDWVNFQLIWFDPMPGLAPKHFHALFCARVSCRNFGMTSAANISSEASVLSAPYQGGKCSMSEALCAFAYNSSIFPITVIGDPCRIMSRVSVS